MGPIVYALGALVKAVCAVLLLMGHARFKQRLLLFSGLCFAGLAISNVLVFLDLVVYPQIDLYPWRLVSGIVAMSLLLYGLIWEMR